SHELNIAKYRAVTLGANYHTCKTCQFRQQLRSRADQPRWIVWMQLVFELMDFYQIQGLDYQQRIDKEAIAPVSRYTPCRSMRAGDKTHFLKISHHVANGGGAKVQPGEFGKRAGTYRLALADIPLDQSLK